MFCIGCTAPFTGKNVAAGPNSAGHYFCLNCWAELCGTCGLGCENGKPLLVCKDCSAFYHLGCDGSNDPPHNDHLDQNRKHWVGEGWSCQACRESVGIADPANTVGTVGTMGIVAAAAGGKATVEVEDAVANLLSTVSVDSRNSSSNLGGDGDREMNPELFLSPVREPLKYACGAGSSIDFQNCGVRECAHHRSKCPTCQLWLKKNQLAAHNHECQPGVRESPSTIRLASPLDFTPAPSLTIPQTRERARQTSESATGNVATSKIAAGDHAGFGGGVEFKDANVSNGDNGGGGAGGIRDVGIPSRKDASRTAASEAADQVEAEFVADDNISILVDSHSQSSTNDLDHLTLDHAGYEP